jgi:transcription-repair coupling factor (superfamily II helicase)
LSRIQRFDRLADFRQELRDRYGPIPTPVEWLLRLAELRILAHHWQIAGIHLEGKWEHSQGAAVPQAITAVGPVDLVLEYTQPKKVERLAQRADGRLRIADAQSAYFRLHAEEYEPLALYAAVKYLLRLPDRPV